MSQPMVAFHVNGREVSVQDQQGQTLLDVLFQMQQPSPGAGECSSGPTCAAIGNAIFDAIGVRMRAMPFTPEKNIEAKLTLASS